MKFLSTITIIILFCSPLDSQDLLEGLVGYYSFCGCNANDHSGNENHGILHGNPQCIPGIKGEGFRFNENPVTNECGQPGGDYIELPEFGAIWENGFTVCAWVQYENLSYFERIIDFGNGSGEAGGYPVWFGREGNSNNLTLESWVSSDGNLNRSTGRLTAVNAITNGEIEFYSATIEGNTMRIYVNGELAAQKSGHTIHNVARSNNYIGRSNWCTNDPDFKGFMDEVRIYNRALSPEDIRSMHDSPFSSSGYTAHVCEGEEVMLNMQGGSIYEWSPGKFLNSTSVPNPVCAPDSSITYDCRIIFPDGCFITEQIVVEVHPPVATDIFEIICEGETYAGYTEAGTYLDTLSTRFGCDSMRTLRLDVLTAPRLSEDVDICAGDAYKGYTETGIYTEIIGAIAGCDTILTIDMSVHELELENLEVSHATCGEGNGSVELATSGNVQDYRVFLNGTEANLINNQVRMLFEGVYVLEGQEEHGCGFDTAFQIKFNVCPVFIPNIFSPNADGFNDTFRFFPKNGSDLIVHRFYVFNRWGSRIYSIENVFTSSLEGMWWDGTFKGTDAQTGVYTYYLEVALETGSTQIYNGNVTLIR